MRTINNYSENLVALADVLRIKHENVNEVVYATNIKSGVQYKFENNEWTRSFEGEYKSGRWRLML